MNRLRISLNSTPTQRFSRFGEWAPLFLFIFTLFAISCNDLKVFVPRALSGSFSGLNSVEINEDGKLALDWNGKISRSYDIYLLEVAEGDQNYVFDSEAEYQAPLLFQTLKVDIDLAPIRQGRLVDTAKDVSYVFSDLLEAGKTYALQIAEKQVQAKESKVEVLLIRVEFKNPDIGAAVAKDGAISLSWTKVPGANRYEIYSDATMTKLLGESTSSSITLVRKDGENFSRFYVKAFRGQLADKATIYILLNSSSVEVIKVRAQSPDGIYKAGDVLDFLVDFSGEIRLFGESSITVRTGNASRYAHYSSGSGTQSLSFRYTVQPGDDADDLSTDAELKGEVVDLFGNKVNVVLPVTGVLSLKDSSALIIDTTSPSNPSSVGFSSAFSNSGSFNVSWAPSADLHFKQHQIRLCSDSACGHSCTSHLLTTASSLALTGIAEGVYHACVRGEDTSGNLSSWISSLSPVSVDSSAPYVVRAFSQSSNGSYAAGSVLTLGLVFNEPVIVTGSLRWNLANGASSDQAVYFSGSGSKILLFNYTVQAGDQTPDLDYFDSTSLSFQGIGSLKDASGNNAVLTLPAPGSANSLSGQAKLVLDNTAPVVVKAYAISPAGTYKAGDPITLALEFSENVVVTSTGSLSLNLDTGASVDASYASGSGTNTLRFAYTVQAGDNTSDLDYSSIHAFSLSGAATVRDTAGNNANQNLPAPGTTYSLKGQSSIVIDTTAPLAPVISSPGNATYTGNNILTVSGFAEANSSINVRANGASIGTTTSDNLGTWSLTLGNALSDGVKTLRATAEDAAHNIGPASTAVLVTIDTLSPTNPAGVTFAASSTNNLNFAITWSTTSTDTNFSLHSVKACTDTGCSTGCTAEVTSLSSPATVSGSNGPTYYACVQGVDLAGHNSNWVNSATTLSVDMIQPTVTSVSSSQSNGTYGPGTEILISVLFSEAVKVTDGSQLGLLLETGIIDRTAVYDSGSDSNTLIFKYQVQAGDGSNDLSYFDTTSLTVGSGTIKDLAGNSASLTLPSLGSGSSLAGQKALVIDTSAPNAPLITSPASGTFATDDISSVSGTAEANALITVSVNGSSRGTTTADGSGNWTLTLGTALGEGAYNLTATAEDEAHNISLASATSIATVDKTNPSDPTTITLSDSTTSTLTFPIAWTTGSSDANFSTHNIKACTASDCSSGCTTPINAVSSPATVTGINGLHYYGCARGLDLAGNVSNWVASSNSIHVDSSVPSVLSVSSTSPNASYNAGSHILITLLFSESVTVTNGAGLGLLLETGSVDRTAVYDSGTGTDTLVFRYIVQAGDSASDLEYHDTAALTIGAGAIDDGSNPAVLILPVLNSATSLAGQKAIIIDTTAPSPPVITSPITNTYSTSAIASVSGTSEANASLSLSVNGSIVVNTTANGSGNWSVTLGSVLSDGVPSLTATAEDAAHNLSASSAAVSVTVDTINPSDPSSVGFDSTRTNSLSFDVKWGTSSTDTNFSTHKVKACTGSDCVTGCTAAVDSSLSPASVTGVNGGIYYGCVKGVDLAGRSSNWVNSATAMTIDRDAPTVTNVTSSTSNGSYKAGDVISIRITFSEIVVVAGDANLGLLMETGSTDRTALYDSGSGSSTLVFRYTVQANDVSTDLEYQNIAALTTGVGSIKDDAGNAAVLALPALNSANSLAGQKAIVIDTEAPTVTSLSSSTSNGSYKSGQPISLSVTFSETVTVVGGANLVLLLETGTTDRSASYVSGSGSAVLQFTYTVQSGDTSSDLEYHSTSALSLGGDTIRDAAANNANITLPSLNSANSIAGQKAIIIDTTVPSAPSITSPVSGSYSASLITGVSGTSEANASIDLKSGSTSIGTTTANSSGIWSITLGSALTNGPYSLSATAEDAAHNVSPASTSVTAIVDTINPTNPASVGFASSLSNNTSFNVTWGSASTDTNFSSHKIKACTDTGCSNSCTSEVSSPTSPATVTGTNGLTYYGCVQGLDLAGRTSSWINSVTNLTVDTSAPTVTNVGSSKTNGSYKAPEDIYITVTFSENVVVTGNASLGLELETGTVDRIATYDSGSGSNTLIFKYAVQAGDSTNDLEYKATNSLTTGSGTIKDNAGNTAMLTLPALASANSLGGQKAIVIDAIAPSNPIFTSPTNGATITSPITQLQGTAEANATVEVFQGLSSLGTTTASAGGSWTYPLSSAIVVDGNYDFSALARDAVGNESGKTTINVAVSIPPATVNAGSDILTSTATTVLGSTTNAVSRQWTKVSGPGTVTFGSSTSNSTTVTLSSDGAYVLRLTATNNAGFSVSDDMILTYDSTAPVFSGITDIWQLSETSVRVFWNAATDAIASSTAITYELCYTSIQGNCTGASFTAMSTFNSNRWDRIINGLTSGTAYEVMVRAVDPAGNVNYGGGLMTSGGLDIKQVAGLSFSRCFLLNSGIVKCAGQNDKYQLGQGGSGTTSKNSPVTVVGLSGVKKIAAGDGHYCAIMSDDSVKCWGRNDYGQVGAGSVGTNQSTPQTVSGLSGVVDISLQAIASCALLSDTSVKCWGRNDIGQLGNGSTTDTLTPTAVSGLTGATFLRSGAHFACAYISGNKTIKCWGQNHRGQIGNGNTSNQTTPSASSIANVESFALGEAFTCAIVTSGAVYCWGYGGHGSLGRGSGSDSSSPVAVTGIPSGASSIVAGHGFACATMSDTSVKCWGSNDYAQFGNESTSSTNVPITSSNLYGAINLSPGWQSMCGKFGNLWKCWGRESNGESGNGTLPRRLSPAEQTSFSGNVTSVVGAIDHSCALLNDGTVSCWGNNAFGQIGSGIMGSFENNYARARPIPGLSGVTKLYANGYFTCALLNDSTVKCWGRNNEGQLGNASTTDSSTPQTVVSNSGSGSLSGIVDLGLGSTSACAIISDGSMQCWGKGGNGLLGNGIVGSTSSYPVVASSFSSYSVKQVVLGIGHLCALLNDTSKTVMCLGKNDRRQVGDNSSNDRSTPVTTGTGFIKLSALYDNTCGIKTDGSVYCWGYNNAGQQGSGSFTTSNVPVQVIGISSAIGIGVGSSYACATTSGGSMKCWGEDDDARLAVPSVWTTGNQATPLEVPGISLASSTLGIGMAHGCLVLTDGRLECWGFNNRKQTGVDNAGLNGISPDSIVVNFSFGD